MSRRTRSARFHPVPDRAALRVHLEHGARACLRCCSRPQILEEEEVETVQSAIGLDAGQGCRLHLLGHRKIRSADDPVEFGSQPFPLFP